MAGTRGRFRLARSSPPTSVNSSPGPTATSSFHFGEFQAYPDPTPPKAAAGSFEHDSLPSSPYTLSWDDWTAFQAWLLHEEASLAIELHLVNTYLGLPEFERKCRYVCSRGCTGGRKVYSKQHPEWNRKRGPKRTDCKCILIVKQYPGTSKILGRYSSTHNHPIGNANLPFIQIPKDTRERIAGLLRLGVSADHILKTLHRGIYDNEKLFTRDSTIVADRTEFIELRDIRRIQKAIEAETVRLHPDDGESSLRWIERLRRDSCLLGFKSKTDPAPAGSNLDSDTFTLMIQTPWQKEMYEQYGEALLCIDATHNVSMYENLNLTTLVVRDDWGHGIPVAWMIASSGSEATIHHFLSLVRLASPSLIPRLIMSDFDWAQINACLRAYYGSIVLLCWWHVLHAWQQHFKIKDNERLWTLLKEWIRITNADTFNAAWVEIKSIAPVAFIDYLTRYWMPVEIVKMWSGVYRTERTIFQNCDTNMLVEAWHSILKGKFFHGKRNRRLDHLLDTLLNAVLPYYALKQRRQDLGFEGPDLEVKKREKIALRAQAYTLEDIEAIDDDEAHYIVKSQSDPSKFYDVDLDTYTCTCLDYPLIEYCKHLHAVQILFAEPNGPLDERIPRREQAIQLDVPSLPPPVQLSVPPTPAPNRKPFTILAEKLDRLAARLRRPRKNDDIAVFSELENAVDAMLLVDTGNVLPSAQRLPPVLKPSTARSMMLPAVKTRRMPAGDPSYGGGKASGSKAKGSPKKKSASTSTPQTATTRPPAHPPALLPYPPPALAAYPTSYYYTPPSTLPAHPPYFYYPFSSPSSTPPPPTPADSNSPYSPYNYTQYH